MQPSPSQLIFALLFTSGDTWRFSELMQTLNFTEEVLHTELTKLQEQLQSLPVMVMIHNETVTLVTRPEYKDFLKTLEEAEVAREFSKGALESLALIAYHGPITKSDIDYIRGVNSQFMLRNLVLRGMIEKQTGKGNQGYVVTADALRFLGVTSPDQLDQFDQFHQEIQKRIPVEESQELVAE